MNGLKYILLLKYSWVPLNTDQIWWVYDFQVDLKMDKQNKQKTPNKTTKNPQCIFLIYKNQRP